MSEGFKDQVTMVGEGVSGSWLSWWGWSHDNYLRDHVALSVELGHEVVTGSWGVELVFSVEKDEVLFLHTQV